MGRAVSTPMNGSSSGRRGVKYILSWTLRNTGVPATQRYVRGIMKRWNYESCDAFIIYINEVFIYPIQM